MGEIISISKNKTLVSKFIYEKDDRNNYVLDEKGKRIVDSIETK
jgi:hypothetical protein